MRITDQTYFSSYQAGLEAPLKSCLEEFDFANAQVDVGYRVKASAVYSSNIEGNSVDLNSFMNSILAKGNFKPGKEIQEIEDLVLAYEFAQENDLNEKNLLNTHKTLSRILLVKDKRGIYRNDRMGVFDQNGLVYLAIEPEKVKPAMHEFFQDIQNLIVTDLSLEQIFYHAALIHLKFAHIHPFWDGNGRAARLLEKWFLAHKLNGRTWKLQSEKYYKEHLAEYYAHINLGPNYYELKYDRCVPFLSMLPLSLKPA